MTVRDLVVIGGGIAGLIVAHDAARAGLDVELFEADERTGGLLRGQRLGEVVVDVGAESFATRTSGVADLIADAGLELPLIAPAPGGAHLAFIGADTPDGNRVSVQQAPLPQRTVLGIPADPLADDVVRIIGAAAAAEAAAERALPAWTPADAEPTLADLVTWRCGPTLTRTLVDPLCRSVYSVPAAAARLSRLHPTLWQAFVEHGSLLTAAAVVADAQHARTSRASGVVQAGAHGAAPRAGSAVAGIHGGMWRLAAAVDTAARSHGAVIRTGVPVAQLELADGGPAQITLESGETVTARRTVVATGSAAARRLLRVAAEVSSPPVRVIAALVHAPALDAHPVGSGVIVAADVPTAAKALTHVTAKWSWAAEVVGGAGHHLVRLSARDAAAPGLDTGAELAGEIATLTGIPLDGIEIIDAVDQRWADAVAAPVVDDDRRAALAARGLHLAGAAIAGTGLASVVPHARSLAEHLITKTPTSVLNASQGSNNV